jgi:serpin B
MKINTKNILWKCKFHSSKVAIPGFGYGYGYDINLVQPLKDLGFVDAFLADKADFSKMVSDNNVYIGDILHKTFIQFSEIGTKAGATTVVQVLPTATPGQPVKKAVYFDHPFIYAIVESGTNLPIFIGTVMNPTKAN